MKETIVILLLVGVMIAVGFILFTPSGSGMVYRWDHSMKKARDSNYYETRKQVEDTCRASQSSYTADKLMWEQYKDSSGEEKSWANQARMRANTTASTYNNYMLKNSHLFENNVPPDIAIELQYLK